MKKLLDIIKGALIGIANVIPGFSGGTMAVILHSYERIVDGLGNLFKHPLKVIKDLWALLIGMLIGIVFAIVAIAWLLKKFPLPTILFFVGLIIGSIPQVFRDANKDCNNKLNYLLIIPAIVILVSLPFINGSDVSTNINIGKLIIILIMGVIAAGAMVVPGISGSLTLMAFGYYTLIITSLKDLMSGVIHLDNSDIKNPLLIGIFFAIGAVVGLVFISKLISILIKKDKSKVYFFILGLLLASPFSILYTSFTNGEYEMDYKNPIIWIIGIILLAIGTCTPIFMEKYSAKIFKKKNEQQTKESNQEEGI